MTCEVTLHYISRNIILLVPVKTIHCYKDNGVTSNSYVGLYLYGQNLRFLHEKSSWKSAIVIVTTSVVNHCSAVTSDLCIFVCGPEWGMGGQGRGKYLSNYIIFIFVFGWVVTTSKSDSYTGTLGMEKDISSRELETLKWLSYVLLANIVSHSHCRWYLVHRPWDYLKYNIDRGQIPAYKLIILMNNPVGYLSTSSYE